MINRTRRSFTAFMLILSILLTTIPVSSTGTAVMDAEALSRESQIFNYVHREVFEENAHVQRLAAEESLDSYVFLNADGSRTAYFLDEPVKFVDSSGTVREKDITLTYAANTFSTTRNNVSLQIPTNLSTGVRLGYGGYDVSIVPQGSSLTLPRLSDNSVIYDNYFGTGTKLIYSPTLDGVKEDIVLTAYRGVSSFSFLLNTDGLNVYHTAEDRWYLAEYEEAEIRFWLGNVEVFDANLKPSLGIMTVAPIIEGQRYRLTIFADPSFLTDPATAYPVTIDPTMAVSDDPIRIYTIEDAPIYEGYPTSNFGSYQYNRAGYAGTAYKRGRTVVKLTGLLNNSTFQSLAPTNIGTVKFYIADASGGSASTVNLYPINASWTENTVTWANIHSSFTMASDDKKSASIGNGAYSYFDITSIVQKWKLNCLTASYGFMLIGANESTVDRSLYSSENSTTSKRPYVEVQYYTNNYMSYYKSGDYFRNSVYPHDAPGSTEVVYDEDGLQKRANCYAYAFRYYHNQYGSRYMQQPGEFANKQNGLHISASSDIVYINETVFTYSQLSRLVQQIICDPATPEDVRIECFYQLMQADGAARDYTVERYTGTSIPSASTYTNKRLIALVVSNSSFHFYMQHSDNTWSHKDGSQQPTNHCIDCGLLLTNNNIQQHAKEGSYGAANGVYAVAFFYITKTVEDTAHSNGQADDCKQTLVP